MLPPPDTLASFVNVAVPASKAVLMILAVKKYGSTKHQPFSRNLFSTCCNGCYCKDFTLSGSSFFTIWIFSSRNECIGRFEFLFPIVWCRINDGFGLSLGIVIDDGNECTIQSKHFRICIRFEFEKDSNGTHSIFGNGTNHSIPIWSSVGSLTLFWSCHSDLFGIVCGRSMERRNPTVSRLRIVIPAS